MKNEYYVYKHTTPNGLVYIGITNQEPNARWLNGRGYKKNPLFFDSILLYGWLNIKHEILFSKLSKEEACQKEVELIKEYRSDEIEYGFNSQSGGNRGYTHNSQTRKRLAEISKERWQDPEFRKKVHDSQVKVQSREDIKKKKSEWSKKRYHEDDAYREKFLKSIRERMNKEETKQFYREVTKKKWNEPGYREQMSQKMTGANNPSARAIEQYTLDGVLVNKYSTCKEAAEKNNILRSGVSACASGHQKTAGGYIWRYADGK